MKISDIKQTYNHPLNKKRKFASVLRYFKLGLYMRVNNDKMFIHHYIHNTKLLVGKQSTSSILQYLNSLNDFDEMGLLLHFLRKDDLFIDVGANVGVFSVLAAGVSNANCIAIEPSKENIELLHINIALNELEEKISHIKCAVGHESGEIVFSEGLDAINRVVRVSDKEIRTVKVKQETLDNLLADKVPCFLKIDVEGYEVNVLKGAKKTLKNPKLQIILIETNGLSEEYKLNQKDIFLILEENGFSSYDYSPFERKLSPCTNNNKNNTIFIRNIDEVKAKIDKSELININGLSF